MFKQKIIINYGRLGDTELEQKTQEILAALTGNAAFPTPQPPLADVQTALDEFEAAMLAAANRDHIKIELKNLKREALLAQLNRLAQYVQVSSDGGMEKMLSSGFDLSKTRGPVGPLPKPSGFKVSAIGTGTMKLSLNAIDGADNYQYEYRKADSENWQMQILSKSRVSISGLESGMEYLFRVTALGSNPTRVYSDVLRSFAL